MMEKKSKIPLSVSHPELLKQWHPTKNGDLQPSNITAGSNKKVWWKCSAESDHEWIAVVASRAKSSNCPFCSGRRVCKSNSLATLHPCIAEEWHPVLNDQLTPADVRPGSGKKVWWKCADNEDHVWEATVGNRVGLRRGCPVCAGKKTTKTTSLQSTHPELAAEWHPSRNGLLRPSDVPAGSNKYVWWKCSQGVDHEWRTKVSNRGISGRGCPFCQGKRACRGNSLADVFPDIAKQWDSNRNKDLTPEQVLPYSSKKVWWTCTVAEDHRWEAAISSRTGQGSGCPSCAGRQASQTNSLEVLYPNIARELHPTRNDGVRACDIPVGSNRKLWWQCRKHPDHEWQAQVISRCGKQQTGCPFCRKQKVTKATSLANKYPNLADEWHADKNGELKPSDVLPGSKRKVWWKCPKASDHEWETPVYQRTTNGSTCPFCMGRRAASDNSLAKLFPSLAAEWHPTLNLPLQASQVPAGSGKKVWWRCPNGEDHEWKAKVADRSRRDSGCPFCSGKMVCYSNSLEHLYPEIGKEWHPLKNEELVPSQVVPHSNKSVWWQCEKDPDHEWKATCASRVGQSTGCPFCNRGWTVTNIRNFVQALLDKKLLGSLEPSELFLLAIQNGLYTRGRDRTEFVKALISGKLPQDSLKEFAAGENSHIDVLLDGLSAEDFIEDAPFANDELVDEHVENSVVDEELTSEKESLPELSGKSILDVLESNIWTSADEEAVHFLVSNAVAKLWKRAYQRNSLAELKNDVRLERANAYAERARSEFLEELSHAESLEIPENYQFEIADKKITPNLMQRHIASLVRSKRRIGNWSGTGAGKTLSAVLASRVIDAKVTVVLCPNAVVSGWKSTILNAFPDSQVITKTLAPKWSKNEKPRYLVLNYEKLQQADSKQMLDAFLLENQVDFVVIDEIHYAKQRSDEASKRRRLTERLCAESERSNPSLSVLGMSATPVINNLKEGVSMLELVTGVKHDDLSTISTVANCMKLHQQLVRIGTRWMPPYPKFGETNPRINVDNILEDVKALPRGSKGLLSLEQLLLEQKLDCILEHVTTGTLIYTEFVEGMIPLLRETLTYAGWRVGQYTGRDKSGLESFKKGELDVLIGSSSVGTGVDGLQHCANKLIIASAPWTSAAYEQLVGRLVRQGQEKPVEVIFPITYANVNGEEWSWCESRLNRIQYKKSIADAAVDGVVPTGHLRTPSQAYKDVMGWLERLENGDVNTISRRRMSP